MVFLMLMMLVLLVLLVLLILPVILAISGREKELAFDEAARTDRAVN